MGKNSTWLCEKCGLEMNSHQEYVEHKGGHASGRIPDKQVDPVSGETIGEDPVVVEQPKKEPIPEVKQAPVQQQTDRKPVRLTYFYEGNCEQCGKQVNTLELDIASDHFTIAYCTACKRQIEQRKVEKL